MDNIINPILKPENDQSNWKDWQKNPQNQFLKQDLTQKDDPVNHPSHYTDGKIEVIDFIEDKNLGFHLGNAVKYISRAGKKDPNKEIEDLEKAIWYTPWRRRRAACSGGCTAGGSASTAATIRGWGGWERACG